MTVYGWSPTIGDPDVLGWVTVAAYLAAAVSACLAAPRATSPETGINIKFRSTGPSRPFWLSLAMILFFLAINKQLDLQSLLTAVARHWSIEQHWYDRRQDIQREFIIGVLTGSAMLAAATLIVVRRQDRPARFATAGITVLIAFIAIRAASFHHVDVLLGSRYAGVKLNHILELGGIGIIIAAAWSSIRR